jgi:hypothetical protein
MPRKSIPLENGYDLFEGLSFFQKTIREGKLNQALYWGHYLFLEKSYATSAFRRMRIIAHEDIGLINPLAVILIDELHNRWKKVEWDKRDSNLWKAGVKFLCKSTKNKENDWYLIMAKHYVEHGWEPDKESNLYISVKNGHEEAAFYYAWQLKKKDDKEIWMILKDSMVDDPFIRACYNSYLECKGSKGADGFWSLAILYISRSMYKLMSVIYGGKIDVDKLVSKLLDDVEDIDISNFKPKIPDYYYDMHTYKGRSKGRGFRHWYLNCNPNPLVELPDEKFRINDNMLGILDSESLKKKKK